MEQFHRGELVFDVIDEGPADGPVVVLLHGFPEQNTMWQAIIPALTAQGYRCLAPRQRGYSPGARPPRRRDYRVDELAEDVRTLIDASGAQRVHLVGHDWGGAIAWRVAQLFPDRLLTMTSLSVPHPGAFSKAILTSGQALASWYMLFFQLPRIPEWYLLNGRGTFTLDGMVKSRSQHDAALVEAEAKAIREPGALTAALNWYRAFPLSNSRDAGKKVNVPAMLIWSDGDIALKEKGARLTGDYVLGDYRFEVLEGVSHWILDEQPDKAADLLLEWLAAHNA
ncbi:MAG TPA: alpha/beta fold hydrolase [Mycobacterium sp.]|nr:alpha/beta fold hydrolase [Mycobacterium sp.]